MLYSYPQSYIDKEESIIRKHFRVKEFKNTKLWTEAIQKIFKRYLFPQILLICKNFQCHLENIS